MSHNKFTTSKLGNRVKRITSVFLAIVLAVGSLTFLSASGPFELHDTLNAEAKVVANYPYTPYLADYEGNDDEYVSPDYEYPYYYAGEEYLDYVVNMDGRIDIQSFGPTLTLYMVIGPHCWTPGIPPGVEPAFPGSTITLTHSRIDAMIPSQPGYTFLGWITFADGIALGQMPYTHHTPDEYRVTSFLFGGQEFNEVIVVARFMRVTVDAPNIDLGTAVVGRYLLAEHKDYTTVTNTTFGMSLFNPLSDIELTLPSNGAFHFIDGGPYLYMIDDPPLGAPGFPFPLPPPMPQINPYFRDVWFMPSRLNLPAGVHDELVSMNAIRSGLIAYMGSFEVRFTVTRPVREIVVTGQNTSSQTVNATLTVRDIWPSNPANVDYGELPLVTNISYTYVNDADLYGSNIIVLFSPSAGGYTLFDIPQVYGYDTINIVPPQGYVYVSRRMVGNSLEVTFRPILGPVGPTLTIYRAIGQQPLIPGIPPDIEPPFPGSTISIDGATINAMTPNPPGYVFIGWMIFIDGIARAHFSPSAPPGEHHIRAFLQPGEEPTEIIAIARFLRMA